MGIILGRRVALLRGSYGLTDPNCELDPQERSRGKPKALPPIQLLRTPGTTSEAAFLESEVIYRDSAVVQPL